MTQATEVVINTGAKTIQLLVAGNLDNTSPARSSGVTLQALYSFLKEEWKDDVALNKFRFPLLAIFEAKFDLINGWAWADATTREMIRDAGWREVTGNEYSSIITLGNMDDSAADQAYYQQVTGFDASVTNFAHTGELNDAILVYNATGPVEYRDFLKVFLREQGKTYDVGSLLVDQDLAALTYQAYRLPLVNGSDLNVVESDANIDSVAIYTGMSLSYLKGQGFTTAAIATYVAEDVIQDTAGRWAYVATGGTVDSAGVADYTTNGGTAVLEAYIGERQIGASYFAYNRIINANGGTRFQAYEWAQRQLRRSADINADTLGAPNQNGFGVINGNVAIRLLGFVGDRLITDPGVAITNFDANDTNDITQRDITIDGGGLSTDGVPLTTTGRNFPFVAAGTLIFSQNLDDEVNADTLYRMYFVNAGGNLFDTSDAIVVNDNAGDPIQGQITETTITFDFDYDGNVQGGRTAGVAADVVVVAQGLNLATWVEAAGSITATTGIEIRINAADERNYLNP